MIDITATQRPPASLEEKEKPIRLRIAIQTRSVREMRDSLLLLADSVSDIIESVNESQIPW